MAKKRRWQMFKPSHQKVAEFRAGRTRQNDADFVRSCGLGEGPTATRAALAVRRAVASVGLVDSQFILADDRYPEELDVLPIWDSMDWLWLIIELEDELGRKLPDPVMDWPKQGVEAFTVRGLVWAIHDHLANETT